MAETIKARMKQMRGAVSEWEQNKNFIPESGEIIIINDKNAEGQSKVTRMRVGDGVSSVEMLKNITGEVYVQDGEPEGAGEGAIWLNPEDTIPTLPGAGADWEKTINEEGYLANKPFEFLQYNDNNLKTMNFSDGKELINITQSINGYEIEKFYPKFSCIDIPSFTLVLSNGETHSINRAVTSIQEVETTPLEDGFYLINGNLFSMPSTVYTVTQVKDGAWIHLALFVDYLRVNDNFEINQSTLFLNDAQGKPYLNQIKFKYYGISVQEKYKPIFKTEDEVRIRFLDEEVIANLLSQGIDDKMLFIELSRFKKGDVILLPSEIVERLPSSMGV